MSVPCLSTTLYLLVPFFFYLITNILPLLPPPPSFLYLLVFSGCRPAQWKWKQALRSQVRSVPSPSYPVHTSGKITTGPCHCLRDCQQVPTISDKKCSEFCTFLPTECLSHGFGTTVVPPLAPYWSKLLNRNQKWSSRTSTLLFWGEGGSICSCRCFQELYVTTRHFST